MQNTLSAIAGFVPKQFAAHARAGAARLLLWSRGGDGRRIYRIEKASKRKWRRPHLHPTTMRTLETKRKSQAACFIVWSISRLAPSFAPPNQTGISTLLRHNQQKIMSRLL
jgi:hypothetical protein